MEESIMNLAKSKRYIKVVCILLLMLFIKVSDTFGNCANFTFSVTSVPSDCQSNGQIIFSVPTDVQSMIRMSDAEYSLASTTPGGFSIPFGHIADGIIRNVPPDTYTAKMRAFCTSTGKWEVSSYENEITVRGSYVIPEAFIVSENVMKSLNCIHSGVVPISINSGKGPYTITITSKPDAYVGQLTFSLASAGIINIENLAPGSYTFAVSDQCTYNILLSVSVGVVSNDFPTSPYYAYIYAPNDNSCDKAMISGRYTVTNTHELYYYWNINYSKFYEVKFTYDGIDLTNWQAINTSYTTLTLPSGVTLATMRQNNKKITVYLRLKDNTTCQSSGQDLSISISYVGTGVTHACDLHTRYFYLYGMGYAQGALCYPVNYEVRKGNCTTGELISSGTVTTRPSSSYSITVPNAEYGATYTLCYTDASGYQGSSSSSASYMTPSMYTQVSRCMPDVGKGYVYIYNVDKAQQIRLISAPAGAPSVSTIYNGGYSYYPYGSSYRELPAGTYQFEITDSCGKVHERSATYTHYEVKSFNYRSENTCDGLRVYPTGQYSAGASNITPYFRIHSNPSGVNLGNTVITPGGYFVFPTTGRYIIQMQASSGTSDCAMDTIIIDYVKKTVSLDGQKTSAYVCVGETVGHITLVAKDGSGNYTYEITGSGLPSNNTGKFTYGSPGATYSMKISDTECNTSFSQDVTLADLNTARIVYMDKSDGEYCFGESINLHCLTLGNTEYSWTGPGFSSNDQDPVISPATLANKGIYTVSVQPEFCGTPISQSLEVNVSGFNNIAMLTDIQVCEGESFTLTVQSDETPQSYQWHHNNVARIAETAPVYSSGIVGVSDRGKYHVVLTNEHNCTDSAFADVKVYPLHTIWTAVNNSTEWNDDVNWNKGAPGPCTYAVIPGGKNYYPSLYESSVEPFVCDTIEFLHGGEMAKTNLLNYNGSKVNLDLSSNRWYMLSPPLRHMYSGDYFVGSPDERYNPAVYIMKYQSLNPQTGRAAVSGDWSRTFNTLDENLEAGRGYTIWVEKEAEGIVSTFSFPKSEMKYTYYYENGTSGGSVTIPDRSYKNRFTYESAASSGGIFTLPVVSDMAGSQTAIIGNPFMSHLDFYEFWKMNQSKINNNYYIWTGGDFDATAMTASGFLSTDIHDERYIAPMQSIVLTKKDPSVTLGTLTFSFDMSVVSPSNLLKSSVNDMNAFRVELTGGERSSRIAICYDPLVDNEFNALKDMYSLFPPNEDNSMVLYTMLGDKAASIRTIGDLSERFELGIRTQMTGDFTLKALVPDYFSPDKTIYLIDYIDNRVIDFRKNPVYNFNKDKEVDLEGRFFLMIGNSTTGFEDYKEDLLIRIYSDGEQLHVMSDIGDLIREIEVLAVNGSVLMHKDGLNSNHVSFAAPQNQPIVIVKAITGMTQKVTKIRVK